MKVERPIVRSICSAYSTSCAALARRIKTQTKRWYISLMICVHLVPLIPSRGIFRVGEVAAGGRSGVVFDVLVSSFRFSVDDLLTVLLLIGISSQGIARREKNSCQK